MFQSEQFKITTAGGIIFSCSDPDEGLDVIIAGDTRTLLQKMQADVQRAEDVLYSAAFKDPDEGWRKYLDVDSFVDWYIVSELGSDFEIPLYGNGRYMYYDPDKQKYCMGPLWDCDNFFRYGTAFLIKDSEKWWTFRLFQDPYFVSRVQARWNERKQELGSLGAFIDERAAYLRIVQEYDFQRWGKTVNYQWAINNLKSCLTQQIAWFDTAINGL